MKAINKHLVFVINLGGGPEAFIKNLLPIFKENQCRVSLVIKSKLPIPKERFDPFFHVYSYQISKSWKSIPIQYLKNGGSLAGWAYRLYKRHEEYCVIQVLKRLALEQSIDVVEITEGFGMQRLHHYWKVVTRAHGSDWSFRIFCQDQVNNYDHWKKKGQRFQHLHSKANFAISQHTTDHLTEVLELPSDLIRFQPYPIPIRQFSSSEHANIPGVPAEAEVVLSIGRIEKRKGMDVLVKAMIELWKQNRQVYLVLLGSESGLTISALMSIIPQPYRHLLIHPGFVPYTAIPSYYKRAAVYVSASQYETFGYTLLEAMAAGAPVICTDRGAMPELIQHDVNGLCVPFGDEYKLAESIIHLLSNKELSNRFIKTSLLKASQYDLNQLGQKILVDLISYGTE